MRRFDFPDGIFEVVVFVFNPNKECFQSPVVSVYATWIMACILQVEKILPNKSWLDVANVLDILFQAVCLEFEEFFVVKSYSSWRAILRSLVFDEKIYPLGKRYRLMLIVKRTHFKTSILPPQVGVSE